MKRVGNYKCAWSAGLAKRLCSLGILTAVALTTSIASAAVQGNLQSGSSGTVTVTLSSVTFNADPAAIGGGNSNVANGTVLTFAGCAGTLGTGTCLTAQEGITILSPFSIGSIPANNFMTFANHSNLMFSVEGAGPGSANTNCGALAIGFGCSVFAGSPIILTLQANNTSIASLAVNGRASDTGVGGLPGGSTYFGSFHRR